MQDQGIKMGSDPSRVYDLICDLLMSNGQSVGSHLSACDFYVKNSMDDYLCPREASCD
jgi:hypothetical protein